MGKKILAVIFMLTAALALAGCSSSNEDNASDSSQQESSTTETQASDTSASSSSSSSDSSSTSSTDTSSTTATESSTSTISQEAMDELEAIFLDASQTGGSAGSSLREAQLACRLIVWANTYQAADQQSIALSQQATNARSSLTSEQRDQFAKEWPIIEETANGLFAGDATAVGNAQDSGAYSSVESLLTDSKAQANWEALEACITA